jgi:predicted DNA-binding transcriptional regulator AlpA
MAIYDLISEAEFAQQRGVTVLTVQRERRRRQGPNFIKLGRVYYYREAAIADWLQSIEVKTPKNVAS